MEALKEADVAAVCNPGLRPVEKGSEYYCPVDSDFGLGLQVFVVPDPFVQSAKGAVGFGESVVNLLVDLRAT